MQRGFIGEIMAFKKMVWGNLISICKKFTPYFVPYIEIYSKPKTIQLLDLDIR